MNKARQLTLRNPSQGSILILTVWMLGMLVLLTISVGHRANQEVASVKYSLQKMQTRYLAWAGFLYVINQIRRDSLDPDSSLFDNLFACGITLTDRETPELYFKEIPFENGSFTVTANPDSFSYGMSDEEGKINLNALNPQNYSILKELFILAGISEDVALRMAADALDWRDEDVLPARAGQDKDKGESLFESGNQQFPAKNRPYDHPGEIRYIKGMSRENYEKIQRYITVYPRQATKFSINFATAPREVLQALARFYSGPMTNTSRSDADNLIIKLMNYRMGNDKIDGTMDDQPVLENQLTLTMSETAVFRAMTQSETKTSRFLAFHITGTINANARRSHIDAVIDRETLTVVSWRND